jgi:ABC-type uncharacterized transport system fused permease/ATPase subunit
MLQLKGWILYFFVCYAACGPWLSQKVGGALVHINFRLEKYEAQFRKSLVHVSEHSESIAISHSGALEEDSARRRFSKVKSTLFQHLGRSAALNAFTEPYNYMQWMVPFFLLVPSYLSGDLSFGDVYRLSTAVGHVVASLDWFINSYEAYTEWQTSAKRMLELESYLEETAAECKAGAESLLIEKTNIISRSKTLSDSVTNGRHVTTPQKSPVSATQPATNGSHPYVSIDIDHINLPTGVPVWRKVELEFFQHQRILISGLEGTGKSTLFKVLAGVWPFGKGRIQLPRDKVLFVPQKPVLPGLCSLREALSYPEPLGTYKDEALLHALKQVGLERLLLPGEYKASAPATDKVQAVVKEGQGFREKLGLTLKDVTAGMKAGKGDRYREIPTAEELALNKMAASALSDDSNFDPNEKDTKDLDLDEEDGEDEDEEEEEEAEDDDEESEEETGVGLSRECNWMRRLSPGMQQRLVFGHVILRQPVALFLDESTCHISKNSVVDLYGALYRNLPGETLIVSISHDVTTMESIHNFHYTIKGKGKNKSFHLAKHHDLTMHDPQPGKFVVVSGDDGWDEFLLCAAIPGHPRYWLCCTTDECGAEFVWTAIELQAGKFLHSYTEGKQRRVGVVKDDDINWICTPPDCYSLWTPSKDLVQSLCKQAKDLQKDLAGVPIDRLEDTLATVPAPCTVVKPVARPGCSALLQLQEEWKEVVLCMALDDENTKWICYTTDDLGTDFLWTVGNLQQQKHEVVVGGFSLERQAPPNVPSDAISWICVPPDCEDLWCPNRDEVEALIEESRKVHQRAGPSKVAQLAAAMSEGSQSFINIIEDKSDLLTF